MILYILLGLVGLLAVLNLFKKKKHEHLVSVYFGVPGCGKTTFASWLSKQHIKQGTTVHSNVPITGTYKLEASDLGVHMLYDTAIILDEAGIEFNNRNYKALPQHTIRFLKFHRHYKTSIDVFSQSHEDMDITIRRLAQRYFCIKKSIIPYFFVRKAIGRRVGIDENTKQIIDEYYWKPFGTRLIYGPAVWKMFNTVSHEPLPEKEWEKW